MFTPTKKSAELPPSTGMPAIADKAPEVSSAQVGPDPAELRAKFLDLKAAVQAIAPIRTAGQAFTEALDGGTFENNNDDTYQP